MKHLAGETSELVTLLTQIISSLIKRRKSFNNKNQKGKE